MEAYVVVEIAWNAYGDVWVDGQRVATASPQPTCNEVFAQVLNRKAEDGYRLHCFDRHGWTIIAVFENEH